MTDIAHACGVAASTVSRALSNPNRVRPETYEQIVQKAYELGYESASIPTQPRQRLARGTIALMLPNLSNPFNLDLIRGCQIQAQAAGFLQILVTSEESQQVETDWLRELSHTVDGIIVSSPRCSDEVLRHANSRVPLVVLNREIPGLSGVVIDTSVGMAQALEYLASLGHERVAYVRGPANSWSDMSRFETLSNAAGRLSVDIVPVGAYRPTLAAGAAAADAVALTDVTAAIFFNDTLAIGALGRFRQRGIRIPEEMSIIGCDDAFGAALAGPPLTTVTAAPEQTGRAITDMLLNHFTSHDVPRRIDRLGTYLTVRESTGPANRG